MKSGRRILGAAFVAFFLILARPGAEALGEPSFAGSYAKFVTASPPVEVPEISFTDPEGGEHTLSEYRGKVVLVNFWATWCPICRLEQGSINSLAKDYRVITVAMDSGGNDAVEQYLAKNGLSFPVIVDPDGKLAARFGVSGVPTGFVIDTAGQIRFREIGLTSGWGWRLRLRLAEFF